MKKNLFYITLCCLSALLVSCDEVDEAHRYVSMPQVEVRRNVLLEDFTGQFCSNCPRAHETMHGLKEQYGDALIAVSIHATDVFGIREGQYPTIVGLMQPEGNVYAERWGASELPTGMVNRFGGLSKYDKWGSEVRSAMEQEPKVSISLSTDYIEDKDSISIRAELLPSSNIDAKLQLWITESNIVAMQQDGTNVDFNYVHNHVFRACVNGTWGEDVTLEPDIYRTFERGIKVKYNWKKEHLSVVAFVYNDAEGVLQARECALFAEDTNE